MKTFLWTSLFWIVAVIAGLLCLGFGNLGTQVLDNGRVGKIMPKNLQTASCDSVVASAFENADWCAMVEEKDCDYEDVDEEDNADTLSDTTWLEEPLSSIIANQEIIYNYLQSSFASINQSIADLEKLYASQDTNGLVIDEKEAQKLQLKAQIEKLEAEMASL